MNIVQVGEEVTKWKVGDRVMALLAGGGYAEEVSLPNVPSIPMLRLNTRASISPIDSG